MDKKINALILQPNLPFPLTYGGRIRRYYITKYLAERCNVFLLTLQNKENLPGLSKMKSMCSDVIVADPETQSGRLTSKLGLPWFSCRYFLDSMRVLIERCLKENDISFVLIEYWYMGYYLDIIKKLNKNIFVAIDCVDLEFIRLQRQLKYINKAKVFKFFDQCRNTYKKACELSVIGKADMLISVTPKDCLVIKKYYPNKNIYVLPTSQDLSYYQVNEGTQKKKESIVFVGSFDHDPNVDAMLHFTLNIFPLIKKRCPATILHIVGLNPTDAIEKLAMHEGVVVHGWVDDVRELLSSCSVYVAPLRIGSGIKGKIIEAMALSLPVVTTRIGAEGLNVTDKRDIYVAESDSEFVNYVVELFGDDLKRKQIGCEARKTVEAYYDWDNNLGSFFEYLEDNLRVHNG